MARRDTRPAKVFADRDEVAEAAQNWSDAVVACRTLGHAWIYPAAQAQYIVRFHYWHVTYHCQRGCGVVKEEELSEDGIKTATTLIYPRAENGEPLYLLQGLGRVSAAGRGALRVESLTRRPYIQISGGAEADEDNQPHSSLTSAYLKENGQWPAK